MSRRRSSRRRRDTYTLNPIPYVGHDVCVLHRPGYSALQDGNLSLQTVQAPAFL